MLAVLALTSLASLSSCAACARGDTTFFVAKFEQDSIGQPPSVSRPFGGPGNELEIQGDVITVRPSKLNGGTGVRLARRTTPDETRMVASLGQPIVTGDTRITWKGYAEEEPGTILGALSVQVLASNDEPIITLYMIKDEWTVKDSSGSLVGLTKAGFDPRDDHIVRIVTHPDRRVVHVCIADRVALSAWPYESDQAQDVARVEAVIPLAITENNPSVFVCDLLRIAQ